MVLRSRLCQGMAISKGQTYRLVGSEYHPGQGKTGGVTHAASRTSVPQFVKTGSVIRLHVETLKSMPGRMPGPEPK
jgi:hypothetical protein